MNREDKEFNEIKNEGSEGSEGMSKKDESNWSLLMWLSLISGYFTVIGFLIPIVLWVIKKDDSAIVDANGKEIINFLISYTIYSLIASVLMFVLIGFLIAPIIAVMSFIFIIVGTIKASEGGVYRVPLIFRLVK